ncbi:MAG TPA: hypothetical protein VFN41_08525 [Candidatus Limnocylindrales bacterium]|nr:hypothetical protein [Candidatus Limnocylindrales bacterium]
MDPASVGPPILSGSGVALAAIRSLRREDPEWQRSMRFVYTAALGQALLGDVV